MIKLKELLKEINVVQYGQHKDGKLYFQIGNGIYQVQHYSGGTVVKPAKKVDPSFKKVSTPDRGFASKIIDSIEDEQPNSKGWYPIKY